MATFIQKLLSLFGVEHNNMRCYSDCEEDYVDPVVVAKALEKLAQSASSQNSQSDTLQSVFTEQQQQYFFDEMHILVLAWGKSLEDILCWLSEECKCDVLDDDPFVVQLKYAYNQLAQQAIIQPGSDRWRLQQAFDKLKNMGIVGLHNAGYTQQDGWLALKQDVFDTQKNDGSQVIGGFFYHEQDSERALKKGELYVRACSCEGNKNDIAIFQKMINVFQQVGLTVEWHGNPRVAILIKPFEWVGHADDLQA